MYVGSIELDMCSIWVMDMDTVKAGARETSRMVHRSIMYVPALLKVMDEVLMNAVDHSTWIKHMTTECESTDKQLVRNIRVKLDQETCVIEVTNDGEGIDVYVHEDSGVYVPVLIFGHLLTSANYNDDGSKEHTIGGQNGIGAKACNIFPHWFEVETLDRNRHRLYYRLYSQCFEDNMSIIQPPTIRVDRRKTAYTTVCFLPDFVRFGDRQGRLTDDMMAVFWSGVCAM
jgi:DNA topoisomerase-2